MSHTGSSDVKKIPVGIPQGSQSNDQTWEIANVFPASELKDNYLQGITVVDKKGCEVADKWFEYHLKNAIAYVERKVNIKITPTEIIGEQHDYLREDYGTYGFIQLYQYPIIQVTKFVAVYPTSIEKFPLPAEWIKTNPVHGQTHIIPTAGTISQVILGQGGTYLPLVYDNIAYLPNLWHIDYIAGFANGKIPHDIRDVIMKRAAIQALHTQGEITGGLGVSSSSISLDGISQSTSSTKSKGNAFSYRIDEYKEEIKDEITSLQAFHKGVKMTAI